MSLTTQQKIDEVTRAGLHAKSELDAHYKRRSAYAKRYGYAVSSLEWSDEEKAQIDTLIAQLTALRAQYRTLRTQS